jgi:hypothetical protein
MSSQTIPTADEIREQIRARTAEVRALRQMLRLATAAEQAREARARQRPLDTLTVPPRTEVAARA